GVQQWVTRHPETWMGGIQLDNAGDLFVEEYGTIVKFNTSGVEQWRTSSLNDIHFIQENRFSYFGLPFHLDATGNLYVAGTVQAAGGTTIGTVKYALRAELSVESPSQLPTSFSLAQNYPNPFNPKTGIRFQVPGVSDVKLVVYDILGREVAALVNEKKPAGTYEMSVDATGLASGVYFYRLTAGSFVQTKRMTLVK
ncbi:T9SS C-terminal target domain-containing protein, partial [bacterium]